MVGVIQEMVESNAMDIDGQQNKTQKKYFIDTTSIHTPRKGMDMTTFLKDGMSKCALSPMDTLTSSTDQHLLTKQLIDIYIAVEDWDLFENMMEYVYKKHLKSDSILHPVLFSEPPVGEHWLVISIYNSF